MGAGVVVFPLFYVAGVAVFRHAPGWLYLVAASIVTLLLGLQMYRKGPEKLKPIPAGGSLSMIFD